jgi:hypothetical protein
MLGDGLTGMVPRKEKAGRVARSCSMAASMGFGGTPYPFVPVIWPLPPFGFGGA